MTRPTAEASLVLGVDPGSRHTGFGVLRYVASEKRMERVDSGVISPDPKLPLPQRVVLISRALHEIVEKHRPAVAAVEDVFVAKSPRSALILGQARGAVLATLGLCGLTVHAHPATLVKQRVTGRGRATKAQVAQMVNVLLGLTDTVAEDESDALAVAICQVFSLMPDGQPASLDQVKPKRTAGGKRAGFAALARAQGKL